MFGTQITGVGKTCRTAAIAGLALSAALLVSGCASNVSGVPYVETTASGETRFRTDPVSGQLTSTGRETTGLGVAASRTQPLPSYISLPNDTPVAGENILITRPANLQRGGSPDELLRAAGPLPAPFDFVLPTDLRAGRDIYGTYFYYVPRYVSGTLCVLGLRRDPISDGALIVLRNCVPGDEAEALSPFNQLTSL